MLNMKYINFKLEYFQRDLDLVFTFSYDLTRLAQCKTKVKPLFPVCY